MSLVVRGDACCASCSGGYNRNGQHDLDLHVEWPTKALLIDSEHDEVAGLAGRYLRKSETTLRFAMRSFRMIVH